MFVRTKRSVGANGEAHQHLQIVRTVRGGKKAHQKLVGALGRRDQRPASGDVDGLLRSLSS